MLIVFRQKSNQSTLGLKTQREGSLQFLLTPRIAALIIICYLKSLWIFAEVLRFKVGVVFFPFFISLVAERMIVIIAFYSQAILLSE